MITSHTPTSYAELDALVNSARAVRSQTVAALVKSVISAIRQWFALSGERTSWSSVTVSLYY